MFGASTFIRRIKHCRKLNRFRTGFHTFNIATYVPPNFLKLYLLDPLQLVGLPHSFPPLCRKRQRLPKHLELLRRFMLRLRWEYIHKWHLWHHVVRMGWAIEFGGTDLCSQQAFQANKYLFFWRPFLAKLLHQHMRKKRMETIHGHNEPFPVTRNLHEVPAGARVGATQG